MVRVIPEKAAELEGFWRHHHEAWKQGPLNQREYCELHGLPLKRFGNWRDRFKAEDKVRQAGLTFAVAADLWLAAAEAEGLERSTTKRYRELNRLYIQPRLSELKLTALTKPMVQDFRLELLQSKSRAMAGKVLRALSAIISNAQEIGAISQNVANTVKVGKLKREAERVIPPDRADLKAMIAAATDTERPLILTAITTGLRSSELRGLRRQDIDLAAGTISVRQQADQWG